MKAPQLIIGIIAVACFVLVRGEIHQDESPVSAAKPRCGDRSCWDHSKSPPEDEVNIDGSNKPEEKSEAKFPNRDDPHIRHKRWVGGIARAIASIGARAATIGARAASIGARAGSSIARAGGSIARAGSSVVRAGGRAIANGARVSGRAIANGARTSGRAIVNGARVSGRVVANGARIVGRGIVSRGGTVWRGVGRGLRTTGRGITRGARYVGRGAAKYGGRFIRYGRPALEVMDMVCQGIQLGISIADATMKCPSYRSTLCREAAELRQGSDQYTRAVDVYNQKMTQFNTDVNKLTAAVVENEAINTTIQRIFMMTTLVEELAKKAPIVEDYLSVFRDTSINLHGFSRELFSQIVTSKLDSIGKPTGWTRHTTITTVQFGLSYTYGMANMLHRAKNYRNLVRARQSPMMRFSNVKANGINSMVHNPSGRIGLDNYGKFYKVDRTGRPIRKFSKGELHQIKRGMAPNRAKVTRLFGKTITSNRRGFRIAKTINAVGKIGSVALPIASTAFCIYNIVDMTHSQVQLARNEIRGLKSKLDIEKSYLNGNQTILDKNTDYMKGNFTQYVAGTTVIFAGLLLDSAEEWIENNPTAVEEIAKIRQDFNYINNTLQGRQVLNYDNLPILQQHVHKQLKDVAKLVDANLEVAQIIALVDASMNQTVPPSMMYLSLQKMNISTNLRVVLSVAATIRPNLDYYFGYPLCLYRRSPQPNPSNYNEIPEQAVKNVKFLINYEDNPNDVMRQLVAAGHSITTEEVIKIIATEIYPNENIKFDVNLVPYRQECNLRRNLNAAAASEGITTQKPTTEVITTQKPATDVMSTEKFMADSSILGSIFQSIAHIAKRLNPFHGRNLN